jgi:hypothetical protein
MTSIVRRRTPRKSDPRRDAGPLAEKWLVSFRNPSSGKGPDGSTFLRQFYAPGYYEAYDKVITHAEKTGLQVMWFREKRRCGPFVNRTLPELESICTYCNKRFNHDNPIPCTADKCAGEFCSRQCMDEHARLKHLS